MPLPQTAGQFTTTAGVTTTVGGTTTIPTTRSTTTTTTTTASGATQTHYGQVRFPLDHSPCRLPNVLASAVAKDIGMHLDLAFESTDNSFASGPTVCASPYTCKASSVYYSQVCRSRGPASRIPTHPFSACDLVWRLIDWKLTFTETAVCKQSRAVSFLHARVCLFTLPQSL